MCNGITWYTMTLFGKLFFHILCMVIAWNSMLYLFQNTMVFYHVGNIFLHILQSVYLFFRDVSIAISNLLQTITARWRHGSHSAQMYHSGVCPPRPRFVWPPRPRSVWPPRPRSVWPPRPRSVCPPRPRFVWPPRLRSVWPPRPRSVWPPRPRSGWLFRRSSYIIM